MSAKNDAEHYGFIAKGFHWLIALLVVGLLCVGLYMADRDPSPFVFRLYFFHKSIGISVLVLMALRLTWRSVSKPPGALASHKKWEKGLARVVYALFYVLLIAMPLSGWIMSSAKGFSVSFFGLFTLPDLVHENKILEEAMAEFHEIAAWTIIGLLCLHVAGALKHHVIDKDSTLRRMLPVLALLAVPMSHPAMAQDAVTAWTIDRDKSSLNFEGTQMGAPFKGSFGSFGGDISFDPARPEESTATIKIVMSSAASGSADRDRYIVTEPWFNTGLFPETVYTVTKFEKTSENNFSAQGDLTIRGITLPVTIPFTLILSDDGTTAQAEGRTQLRRLDFGVGSGQWEDTKTVGNDVTVSFSITAHKADTVK